MRMTSWLQNWPLRRTPARSNSTCSAAEQLEVRSLPTVSAFVILGTQLEITMSGDDDVRVSSLGGNVLVEASENGGLLQPFLGLNSVSASSIQSIQITGGDQENTIDLSSISASAFLALTSIQVDGGHGGDSITGSADIGGTLNGNHGNDTIVGLLANDTIDGGDGNDDIQSSDGDDSVIGGDGSDSIQTGIGNDSVDAGNGQDTVLLGDGDDSLYAGNGEDSIDGGDGEDVLNGDGGTDTVDGGLGNDFILGGEFNDILIGGVGNDTIDGQSGKDSIVGGVGDDSLSGGSGNDTILGGDGLDTINGNGGNDSALGGLGNDSLVGGSGNDTLDAQVGDDTVLGQGGDDSIFGREGRDSIFGGAGDDFIATGTEALPIPPPQIAVSDGQVTEGDSGTKQMTFFAQLSSISTNTITANFATSDGTATVANQDYNVAIGSITFAPGVTLQQFSVTIVGDTTLEADETFTVTISNPINATLFNTTATGNILNDELGPGGIQVTGTNNVLTLQNAFLGGNGAGLNVTNVSLQGHTGFGGSVSSGTFTVGNQLTYGLRRGGIVLSSGDAPEYSSGPNTSTSNSTSYGIQATPAQQALLQPITGETRHFDVTQLTINFDLQPGFDTLFFELSFGSEEWPEFVGSFIDGFGLFVNGTNIAQVNGSPINIDHPQMAATPGTELDGVLTPNGSARLLFQIQIGSGALNNSLDIIIADAGDSSLDTTVYLSSLGAADPDNPPPPPPPPAPPPPPPPARGTEDDTALGGDGNDTIVGGFGFDLLNGNAGDDSISGADNDDTLLGGNGADTLDGGNGNDSLNGQGGPDVLNGGEGDDTLNWTGSGGGDDTIDGGLGDNKVVISGTNAVDTFAVGQNATGLLQITQGSSTLTVNPTNLEVDLNTLAGNDTVTVGNIDLVFPVLLVVNGGAGDDTLDATGALLGNVRLAMNGDVGNDSIIGSAEDDTLLGGDGNDTIRGGAGGDTIQGGAGADDIFGLDGDDSIRGDAGVDIVRGNNGNDSVDGGDGDDLVTGHDGNDVLFGSAGDDSVSGLAGNDTMFGDTGMDTLTGGDGDDDIDGGFNEDTITGDVGNDIIRGNHGDDSIDAGDGTDTVIGGDGNDTIFGGLDNDAVNGSDGNDLINTGAGNDTILGGDGLDTLRGGGGSDVVLGGDGDDNIDGQGGADTVAGNQGADLIADPGAEINESFILSSELLRTLEAV